jgi:hypothetical protein
LAWLDEIPLSDTDTVIVKALGAGGWYNWGGYFMNEPATREDLKQTADVIRGEMQRTAENILHLIESLRRRRAPLWGHGEPH